MLTLLLAERVCTLACPALLTVWLALVEPCTQRAFALKGGTQKAEADRLCRQAYTVLSDWQQREAYNAKLQAHLTEALDDYTGMLALQSLYDEL